MELDEAMRYRIHGRFEQLLGTEEAAALMAALPAQEMATKADLDHLREVLMLHTSTTVAELGSALRVEMAAQMRTVMQWTVGSMLAAGSLGLAAGRLLAG